MGNTPVVAKENRMAIAAMANVMKITKKVSYFRVYLCK